MSSRFVARIICGTPPHETGRQTFADRPNASDVWPIPQEVQFAIAQCVIEQPARTRPREMP
jgi:hypothetical protein